MRARAVLAAAVITAVAAPVADAAPKKRPAPPVCNLVVDKAGDVSTRLQGLSVFPGDQGLDLLSADIVTDATRITAVLRLAAAPGSTPLYGKRYTMQMNVAGLPNPLVLSAVVPQTGAPTYTFGYYGANPTTGSMAYNEFTDTPAAGKIEGANLTIGASLATIASKPQLGTIRPGTKISGLLAGTSRRMHPVTFAPGTAYGADDAGSGTVYVAGARSCVAPFGG